MIHNKRIKYTIRYSVSNRKVETYTDVVKSYGLDFDISEGIREYIKYAVIGEYIELYVDYYELKFMRNINKSVYKYMAIADCFDILSNIECVESIVDVISNETKYSEFDIRMMCDDIKEYLSCIVEESNVG